MGNQETLASNHHIRTTGCTHESARRLEGTLDELLNARTAGHRVER